MSPYLIDLLATFLVGAGVGFAVGGIWGNYSGYTRGTDDTAARWAAKDVQRQLYEQRRHNPSPYLSTTTRQSLPPGSRSRTRES